MKSHKAYEISAQLYDLIYSWKEYGNEVGRIRQLIQRYKKSPGNDLLEVACGTGGHARHLKNHFSVVGTDINPKMLRVARKNIKGVKFQQADMLHLDLGREFDVVLCLFSSIGYMKTTADLRRVLGSFACHLKPGGVVIIEPWFAKSVYKVGVIHLGTFSNDEVKIARISISKVRGNISILDMHHLVAERSKPVKYFVERHELGMFEKAEFLRWMKESGFRTRFLKTGFQNGRGLFIGIKN
jgi:ubiquinone/menaquinone biosynthesis C-methylase UbiE